LVHEKKIFEDLSKFSLFFPLLGPKRGQPLYLNKSESPSPEACFLPSLVEIGLVVLEKKLTPDGRTTRQGISSRGLRPGELKIVTSFFLIDPPF